MLRLLKVILAWLTGFVQKFVKGWRLEQKSLLFLGFALVVPIGLAFWFVLEVVASRLVMQTVQQEARDYAEKIIAWEHAASDKRLEGVGLSSQITPAVLQLLREDLIDNPNFRHQYLMLDDTSQHSDLGLRAELPTDRERELVEDLASEYRAHFLSTSFETQPAESPGTASFGSETLTTDSLGASSGSDAGTPAAEPKPYFFRDDGPVELTAQEKRDLGIETDSDWYVYYHAVTFADSCMICHARFPNSTAENLPFRVVKVMRPYDHMKVASTPTIAGLIAIAMVTLAATLFVVHWVVRRLVLRPLAHLKGVSEAISAGKTDLRAKIETGDEFKELAEAFNRMLRHMTESQSKLQGLNEELDVRIDQLAQANLNLFEANRLKSDFLANMSHELRTPLNSIIGFSEVLADIPALTDKQQRFVGNIQNSGKLLLEMINDILDLAKVEAGKMTVTPTTFDVGKLVSAQCDLLGALIEEKNMDLQLNCIPLPEVFQDQAKIQQILTNLLSNAIKFTPDGGMITVSVASASQEHFCLTVADTGVGIPEEDFDVIFEKFRQSNEVLKNDGLTRTHSGTGLGLSIVKELCKLLGGEVRLSSQLGTGSKFRVILPMHYTQTKAAEAANADLDQIASENLESTL
ncbi:MAG TPA: two-component sensor histidine kinase [Planctomycetaceae bacterium]|nr:two-component sensor histidine kinase [Planctomycetaceae bacterium]